MAHEMRRRTLIGAMAAGGFTSLAGCGNPSSDDGSGGTGNRQRSLSWSEATEEVLSDSKVQTLREAEMAPGSIQSRSDAREAFRLLGWYESATNVGDTDSISQILEQMTPVAQTLADVERVLSRINGLIEEMKETDIPLAGSAWGAATSASPSLEGFDVAVTEGLKEVREWLSLLKELDVSLQGVANTIAAVENGEVQRATELSGHIEEAVSKIGELESRTSDLRQRLSEFGQITQEAANIAGQLGPLGSKVQEVFGGASDRLRAAAGELGEFNTLLRSVRSMMTDMRTRAEEFTSQRLSEAADLVE